MSGTLNETLVGNFSHSEQAELYPEFVLCVIETSQEWCVSAGLDAYGCAAAGRKLTLNRGLGTEMHIKRKGRDMLPAR
jgi:hypothetical protein